MRRTLLVCSLIVAVPSRPALALDQPNGATIPTEPGCDGGRPTGLAAVFACVCTDDAACNIGDVCTSETVCDDGQRSTCETTMWHSFNDNTCIPSNRSGLDPRAEASTTPETFSPVCPLTFTVLSRGTALFRDAFGWYNVPASGPPDLSDLHVMLDCDDDPGAEAVLDIQSHPDYRGGEIGFFLVTPESDAGSSCAGGDCCATLERAIAGDGHVYYSQRAYNPDYRGADSFIHLLIYDSHVWEHRFYFAWEDIFGGSNNDFTDLLTAVSGVECAGGGARCETGARGVCSIGVTRCSGEDLECEAVYEPEAERCDGLDNDCDGSFDEDATCPGLAEVCHDGRCVPHCRLSDEFTCVEGFACDAETGFCMEEACRTVVCDPGEVCRAGQCVGGCEDVICPFGQSCRLGSCVEPCEGVTCPPPQVCREGVCVPGCGECGGLVCEDGLACDPVSHDCSDDSCAAACPAGTHCSAGACIDDCEGARCPGGQECVDGECDYPGRPGQDGGPGDSGPDGGPDAGREDAAADAGTGDAVGTTPSCSCALAARGPGVSGLGLGLLVCLCLLRLRRAAR